MEHKLYIAICDDQLADIKKTKELCEIYLRDHRAEAEFITYTSPAELLKSKARVDLLFLDVEMEEKSGIAVKDELATRGDSPLVIFVTSHPEAMSRAFNINVIGFLLKPLRLRDLAEYLDTALTLLHAKETFTFIDGTVCNPEEIIWVQTEQGYAMVLFDGGVTKNVGRVSIKHLEELLEPHGLIRVNNGLLVNCRYIMDFAGNAVTLSPVRIRPKGNPEQVTLSVSKRRRKACYEKYLAYCMKTQKYI